MQSSGRVSVATQSSAQTDPSCCFDIRQTDRTWYGSSRTSESTSMTDLPENSSLPSLPGAMRPTGLKETRRSTPVVTTTGTGASGVEDGQGAVVVAPLSKTTLEALAAATSVGASSTEGLSRQSSGSTARCSIPSERRRSERRSSEASSGASNKVNKSRGCRKPLRNRMRVGMRSSLTSDMPANTTTTTTTTGHAPSPVPTSRTRHLLRKLGFSKPAYTNSHHYRRPNAALQHGSIPDATHPWHHASRGRKQSKSVQQPLPAKKAFEAVDILEDNVKTLEAVDSLDNVNTEPDDKTEASSSSPSSSFPAGDLESCPIALGPTLASKPHPSSILQEGVPFMVQLPNGSGSSQSRGTLKVDYDLEVLVFTKPTSDAATKCTRYFHFSSIIELYSAKEQLKQLRTSETIRSDLTDEELERTVLMVADGFDIALLLMFHSANVQQLFVKHTKVMVRRARQRKLIETRLPMGGEGRYRLRRQ